MTARYPDDVGELQDFVQSASKLREEAEAQVLFAAQMPLAWLAGVRAIFAACRTNPGTWRWLHRCNLLA